MCALAVGNLRCQVRVVHVPFTWLFLVQLVHKRGGIQKYLMLESGRVLLPYFRKGSDRGRNPGAIPRERPQLTVRSLGRLNAGESRSSVDGSEFQ